MEYTTKARIKIAGSGNCAIVIDLNDVNFSKDVCNVRNPHITLLYNSSGWKSSELYLLQAIRDIYFLENKLDEITFTCWEKYDEKSNLIGKDSRVLTGLVDKIRKEFRIHDTGRPLHIALRK